MATATFPVFRVLVIITAFFGWMTQAAAQTREVPVSPAAGAAGTTPALVESFEVGKDVYVRALTPDPQRNSMWIGTSTGLLEVDQARRSVKNTFTRADGLANEYVFGIGVDPTGKAWFGTNAGGVSTYDTAGKWKTYFPMHGLADYWVYCFAYDKAGGAWIGTWDGASYVAPGSDTFHTYRSELINVWVYGLAVDAEGKVWFGTEGGVSMYDAKATDGKAWKSWTSKDGLGIRNTAELPRSPNTGLGTRVRHDLTVESQGKESFNPDYVFSVLVDARRGGVWFGTWGGGVSFFDGKGTWKSYGVNDGLAGNIVYGIAQDKEGGLWFATNHGVSHFDGERFIKYGRADGLLGEEVFAVAVDPQGAVWFGTKGGVARVVHQKKLASEKKQDR
ncbi:MAG: two-component regulator propeller domain-containing protein [Alphaproteobacteria bacterium]